MQSVARDPGSRGVRRDGAAGVVLRTLIGLATAALMFCCAVGWAGTEDAFVAGRRAYQAGDVTGALKLLRPPAEAGHAPSQALLAFLLESAALYDESVLFYRRAVEQGDADAAYGLAGALLAGHGVARDVAAAQRLYEQAASGGHTLAVNALAEAALRGGFSATAPRRGASLPEVSTPSERDLEWIRRAAANDHLPSLDFLARALRAGQFGPADPVQARAFEARAEKLRFPNGRPRARRN